MYCWFTGEMVSRTGSVGAGRADEKAAARDRRGYKLKAEHWTEGGRGEHLGRGAGGGDRASAGQNQDAIGDPGCQREIVEDDRHGDPAGSGGFEKRQGLDGVAQIHRRDGLIGEQGERAWRRSAGPAVVEAVGADRDLQLNKSTGKRGSLLLAGGEFSDAVVGTICQFHHRQGPPDRFIRLRRTLPGGEPAHGNHFTDGVGEGDLRPLRDEDQPSGPLSPWNARHRLLIQQHFPGMDGQQTHRRPHQGRLAGPVGPHDRGHRPGGKLRIDTCEHVAAR